MDRLRALWKRNKDLIEQYGMVAVGTTLGLFAVEMIVLVALLRAGVDLEPMLLWLGTNLGADVSGILAGAGTVGIAYAITRVLKPLQIVAVIMLTPLVAKLAGIEPKPLGTDDDAVTPEEAVG